VKNQSGRSKQFIKDDLMMSSVNEYKMGAGRSGGGLRTDLKQLPEKLMWKHMDKKWTHSKDPCRDKCH